MDNLLLLKEQAREFDIILDNEKLSKFECFANYLQEYNSHTNLLSSKDIGLLYEKHFVDSLAFGKYIKPDDTILDIGSGGGFPVIPISIVMNTNKVISIDSTNKKVVFLNNVAKNLDLKNFCSINTRAEEIAFKQNFRECFDIVTARAVGNLAIISELCLPFLKIGGIFIAYKSSKVFEEIEEAKSAIDIMGGKIEEVYEYDLKLSENYKRNLVIIKKIKNTPSIYPRKFSQIKYKKL